MSVFETLSKNKLLVIGPISAILIILAVKWRRKKEEAFRIRTKKQGSVNIGGLIGMDVGGTLTKIVYFESTDKSNDDDDDSNDINSNSNNDSTTTIPQLRKAPSSSIIRSTSLKNLDSPDHQAAVQELYDIMNNAKNNHHLNVTTRDEKLSFYCPQLRGKMHFLFFETRNMIPAINNVSATGITENIRSIGCTGGGAHKYAHEFQDKLGITFHQMDELGCLIRGLQFTLLNVEGECYTYRSDPEIESNGLPKRSDHSSPSSSKRQEPADTTRDSTNSKDKDSDKNRGEKRWQKDVKEHTHKVTIPYETFTTGNSSPFPYLLVNIGSGVSILKVTSPGTFERVSGSSLGGGTYWGLCRLLTKCARFEDVLDIAENGDATEVDMLVRDIYGGGYDAMNLNSSMVASSFGKLVMKDNPREGIKEEDLAIALLMMITNNIGQVSYLNAQVHKCTKIFFVGSFLRHNAISCRRLAFAIDFWSKGAMEALFLTHEGYFGALGTLLQSIFGANVDKILSLHNEESYSFIKPSSSDTDDDDASSKKVFGLDSDFLKKIRNWNPANLRGFNDSDSKRGYLNSQSADGGLMKTNRDNYYSNSNNSSSNNNESNNIIPMSISEDEFDDKKTKDIRRNSDNFLERFNFEETKQRSISVDQT